MSSLSIFFRANRVLFVEHGAYSVKSTLATRYPTYSIFRSLWSNIVKQKETAAETKPDNSSSDSDTSAQKQIDDLLKAVQELQQNRDEINDKYKRALAENENIRRRFQKQVEEAKQFGIQSFCKDLLEVADVLNKATECVPKEEITDKNPHLKNLYEGLRMTDTVFTKILTRHGLVLINPLNQKFDPNEHHALFEQEVDGKPSGTVVVVSKPGYKLYERVIRPALVGVSK